MIFKNFFSGNCTFALLTLDLSPCGRWKWQAFLPSMLCFPSRWKYLGSWAFWDFWPVCRIFLSQSFLSNFFIVLRTPFHQLCPGSLNIRPVFIVVFPTQFRGSSWGSHGGIAQHMQRQHLSYVASLVISFFALALEFYTLSYDRNIMIGLFTTFTF